MNRRKPRVSMGVEVEFFTITAPGYGITRRIIRPPTQLVEKGERFTTDISIGTEYDSMVFSTIREALFLLKSGLRKFILKRYRHLRKTNIEGIAFLGGWKDRFAGAHFHIALGAGGIERDQAEKLAEHVHDHIPFLVALCANSPVWRGEITPYASNRVLLGSDEYCYAIEKGVLDRDHYKEISYNYALKSKKPTFELRVCDSNIPEYLCAVLMVLKAITMGCLRKRRVSNSCSNKNYLVARENAARDGAKAMLFWRDREVSVAEYVKRFFCFYKKEIEEMDIPDELLDVFRLLKVGFNGAEIIRKACQKLYKKNSSTWKTRFGKEYAMAIEQLLSGETLETFANQLGVRLPSTTAVSLT